MQMNLRLWSVVALTALTLTACKKENTEPKDKADEIETHSDDQNFISNEMDVIFSEANAALEANVNFSGRLMDQQDITNICGATAVADLNSNPRTITITYNGNDCSNAHFRSGTVILSIPNGVHWKDAGAELTVTVQNLKIKRLSDNKSVTVNGSHKITNVTGGLLIQLPVQSPKTHTVSGSMTIKFADNSQRTWNVARKKIFSYNNGVVLTVSGDHTEGNNTQISEWGTNRFGNPFTTSITQPVIFRQDCLFRVTAGEIKHEGFATATVKFGLDATGNPVSCPGSGNYYYKLSWTGPAGNTHQVILPY